MTNQGATMNIPEEVLREAAEAVKAAIENEDNLDWWNPEQDYWDRERGGLHTGVEGLIECTSVARAALSAAAPTLMAMAWDEGYCDGLRQDGEGEDGPRYVNPYRKEQS